MRMLLVFVFFISGCSEESGGPYIVYQRTVNDFRVLETGYPNRDACYRAAVKLEKKLASHEIHVPPLVCGTSLEQVRRLFGR